MFYVTIEVTQVDEDLAADAIQTAVDSLSLSLHAVDLPSLEIKPSTRSRGASATFIIESPRILGSSGTFIQVVNGALRSLLLVRLHWVKPAPSVFIDMVPAPLTETKGNND